MILTDAGPLIALIDRGEERHGMCVAALKELRPPMITTWPAFTEAMYLLGDAGGWNAQKPLWAWVRQGVLEIRELDASGVARSQKLMEKYADTPMDLADATLVALAEQLQASQIFTLDSDFLIYRTYQKKSFTLWPPPIK